MLRVFPLDSNALRFVLVDVQEVMERSEDGRVLSRQRTDDTGRLVYRLNCLTMTEGQVGGEVVPIRVALDDAPSFVPLTPVRFTGLVARPWEQNGRSGISLSAEAVEAEHSSNSRPRKADPLATSEPAAA